MVAGHHPNWSILDRLEAEQVRRAPQGPRKGLFTVDLTS